MDYVVHPDVDNIRKKRLISSFFVSFFIITGVLSGTSFFVWHYTTGAKASNRTTNIPAETIKISTPKKEVIGFLPSWSLAENAEVNTDKMTQVIYFGLPVDKNGNIVKQNEGGQILSNGHT